MGQIKSAMEIALEKTKDIQANKESLLNKDLQEKGRRIAAGFLGDAETKLKDQLAPFKGKDLERVREGAARTLLDNLNLPETEPKLAAVVRAMDGLQELTGNQASVRELAVQLKKILGDYARQRATLLQKIDEQYAPKLRQKEEDLARKTGMRVKIDPNQDPEYVKFRNMNIARLDDQYMDIVHQARAHLEESLAL